jgi:emp24/gp25L/p24 family/GOLD
MLKMMVGNIWCHLHGNNTHVFSFFNAGTIAPIEREIRDLAVGLQAVKDEQEYIVIRERVHRDTAESTNSRVMWWSIFQGIVLVRFSLLTPEDFLSLMFSG